MTTDSQQGSASPEEALQRLILDGDLERLEDLLAEFNLFDVLSIARQETQHSAFLAWLLDPRGSHGLRDYFLRGFLTQAAAEARAFWNGQYTDCQGPDTARRGGQLEARLRDIKVADRAP